MKTLTYHADTHTTIINECDEDNALAHLQHEVGGYVEHVDASPLGIDGLDIWINDMGAADGLPYAFSLPHPGGRVDLFGNVVFARCDEYGDTIGLTDSDIKALEAQLHAA